MPIVFLSIASTRAPEFTREKDKSAELNSALQSLYQFG